MLKMLRKKFKRIIFGTTVLYILIIGIILAAIHYSKIQDKLNKDLEADEVSEQDVVDGNYERINFTDDPLSLVDFVKVDVSILPGKMVLSNNCTGILMTTTVAKTFSIQRGIEKKAEFRPNEHDIFADILESFDINFMFIKITALNNDLYYADMFFRKGEKVLNLDAKPSDALAIASRFKTPVYIKKDLLEKAGQNVC